MNPLVEEPSTPEEVVEGWYRNIPGLPPGLKATLTNEVRKVMAPKVVDVEKIGDDKLKAFFVERARKGGLARAAKISPERRAEIAKAGQKARVDRIKQRLEEQFERMARRAREEAEAAAAKKDAG